MESERSNSSDSEDGLHLAGASRRVAQKLLVIFENRFELLIVEWQMERERILRAIWLAMGAAVFALLAGIALTIVIVVVLWSHSPIIALLILTTLYAVAAVIFYERLAHLRQDWRTLPGTLEQLKKDLECLDKNFK